MNKFLTINKNILLGLSLIICLILISMIIFKNYFNNNKIIEISSMPSVDIINPKFTINNKNKKIYVKASKGNFIDKDLILLEENVYFESSDFKIYSDSVTFNRKDETANSKTKSKFESKGTMIISEGFKIKNQGDIIFFDGETSLTLN